MRSRPATTLVAVPERAVSPLVRRINAALLVLIPVAAMAGGGWLVSGSWHSRSTERPVQGWTQTVGRVVSSTSSGGSDATYAPLIEFHAATGESIRFRGPYRQHQPKPGAADRVDYDPRNPQHAHDLSGDASWRWPFFTGFFMIGVGIATAIGYSLLLRRGRRVLPPPTPEESSARNRRFIRYQLLGAPIVAAAISGVEYAASGPGKAVAGGIGFLTIDLAMILVQKRKLQRSPATEGPAPT